MPHSRTDTEQDDNLLWCLPDIEYKTFRYLVNRADPIGICFPKQETIADAIRHSEREIQRALDALHDNAVFRYRRRNAVDPDTRRRLHNVYQVNPLLLVIALELQAEAWSEWDALILQCGNVSIRLPSRINQHQEPVPLTNTSEPVPETSTTNRALTEAGQKSGQSQDGSGATRHNDLTHQHGEDVPKSSVPPARPQYANPDSINTNLPDAAHEQLANDLRQFSIATPLARGFVVTYGYSRTKLAFDQVRKMGEKAREPAAVFRSIIQVRLADDFDQAQQKIFGNRKQS